MGCVKVIRKQSYAAVGCSHSVFTRKNTFFFSKIALTK